MRWETERFWWRDLQKQEFDCEKVAGNLAILMLNLETFDTSQQLCTSYLSAVSHPFPWLLVLFSLISGNFLQLLPSVLTLLSATQPGVHLHVQAHESFLGSAWT
jgi:hypothetical protein